MIMNNKLLCSEFEKSSEFLQFSSLWKSTWELKRKKPTLVTGISESALPWFIVCAAKLKASSDGILIICKDENTAKLYRDLINECGFNAFFYPARDFNFNNMTASHDFEHERLSLLGELVFNKSGQIIVSTPEAVLQTTIPAELLNKYSFEISINSASDLNSIVNTLSKSGYTRVDMVEGVGQFALRGGILDIYSPGAEPWRIEFFGDEIDRIGHFDITTQRFSENDDSICRILPAGEVVITDDIRSALSTMLKRLIKELNKKGNSFAQRILTSELEAVENSAQLTFADKYLPLIYPGAPCLLDYINSPLLLSDFPSLKEKAESSISLVMQSIQDMLETGTLSGGEDGYIRTFDDIEHKAETRESLLLETFLSSKNISVGKTFNFRSRHIPSYNGNYSLLLEDLENIQNKNRKILISCTDSQEVSSLCRRLFDSGYSVEEISDDKAPEALTDNTLKCPIYVTSTNCFGGFECGAGDFTFLDFSAGKTKRTGFLRQRTSKKKKASEAILSYAELETGDYVVHAAYGIGQYLGIENLTVDNVSRDYIRIRYAGTDQLFLPVDQLHLVSKYIGSGGAENVKLSKMGGADWNRAKSKASAAAKEIAKELIQLYAKRKKAKGIAFDPEDDMSLDFAASFEYEETEGQKAAISDINRDMESSCPMERLLCGDVGYGKTEVAIRAAFKAVKSGYQVAVLVPTTILALQHYNTFTARFRGFPATIDMVSRFRDKKSQEAALRKLRRGELDIIIGTHRLISKDVEFKKLGLVIIDEEQRFGVAQKEHLKSIAEGADILTLSATPIPRTLNMAMGGIVDMSVLEEAPGLRTPVQTYVMEHDDSIILEALRRELRRGGQIFYLYNNTEGIYGVASRLSKELPDAVISVAHGKMEKDELEDIWAALVRGEIDILVSTTIIETGVDVPNANTLIIENADRYGLSQLHQIRGRVGRSTRRAYAYFTYKPQKVLSEIAEKRLKAIKEYAQFGAGFKIALRDLEIRGAGNLLGAAQHGHLESVGYDLYVKLLDEAILSEKGTTPEKKTECSVELKCDAYLSKTYISSSPQRMEMYKKIASIENEQDLDDIIDELCDRFGDLPSEALNLCRISYIRALGSEADIIKIDERDGRVILTPNKLDVKALTSLAETYPSAGIRVVMSTRPSVTCKILKGKNTADFLTDVLKKYAEIQKNRVDI